MFGPLGVPELLFILALALLIFGPRKLPEIGRTLGKGMAEFRKASNELKRTLNTEVLREEIRQNDPRRVLRDAIDEPAKADEGKKADEPAKADEGKKVDEPAKAGEENEAEKSAEPAGEGPAPPEGAVARSGASGGGGETTSEPAADSLPSSSTR